jgi:hypothetical protein
MPSVVKRAQSQKVVNVADDMDPRPQAGKAPGLTVDLYAATHTVQLADARICRNECAARAAR